MRYKYRRFKLLSIIGALFVFLLVSSTVSAQRVGVSEKTPEQLINDANMVFKYNNEYKDMEITAPTLDNSYLSYATQPYVKAYVSYFSAYTSPLKIVLFTDAMGTVSEIWMVQDNFSTEDEISICSTSVYASLGLTGTEMSAMVNSSRKISGVDKRGIPYTEFGCDIYSPSMKRRFITHSIVLSYENYKEKYLLVTINAIDI